MPCDGVFRWHTLTGLQGVLTCAFVRYPSGKQAEVLNILLEDVVQGHPVTEQRLKEVLGHTPLQVSRAQGCKFSFHCAKTTCNPQILCC